MESKEVIFEEADKVIVPKLKHFLQKELPNKWLNFAYDHKWFKIFVAEKYGGYECDFPEALSIIQKASSLMGSFGWAINLGAGANYFSGFYNNKGAKQIFSSEKTVLAGSGTLAKKVKEVSGGIIISGEWPKATGANHATHFTANAQLKDGTILSCTLTPDQVKLRDEWELFALKPTSSFAYEAKNAFIPYEYTFEMNKLGGAAHTPIHNMPFDVFGRFCMSAALIGLAEGVANELKGYDLKPKAQDALSILRGQIVTATSKMYGLAEVNWELALEKAENFPTLVIQNMAGVIGKNLFNAVNEVYFYVGLAMADEQSILHQRYKDFMLGAQHYLLKG